MKHSTQCFISRRNTSKFVKPLHIVFSALFSLFHLVIKHWVSRLIYFIKHKTEVVLISSKFRDGPSLDYVNIGNDDGKATSLEVVLDKHMSFDHHVKDLCKSLMCHFRIVQDHKVSCHSCTSFYHF